MLVTENDSMLIKDSQNTLQQNFKIKDLGESRHFLGIEFLRSSKGILMIQRKYTLELISKWGVVGPKPVMTPLEQHIRFTTTDYDKHLKKDDDDLELVDKKCLSKAGTETTLYSNDHARHFLCSTNFEPVHV